MSEKPAFVEIQYLGREFNFITIRLILAVCCFAVYAFTPSGDHTGDLLLVVGFAILIISIIMGFMPHYRTTVTGRSMMLDGLWTSRMVKIDLNSIVKVERMPYSRYLLNNPVYNLHKKGTVRFYAGGKDALHLTDRDGLVYIIGTQHPGELERAVKDVKKA
ncbi:MAG: hypothetical protein INR69_09260 [Mucilaginibacter polytrichastri]|nr:hypothetical protein [Mucilaginibacter polytrichastri]